MSPVPNEGQSLRGQVVDWLFRLEAAPDDRALRAEFDAWLARSARHRQAHADIASIWQDAADLAAVPASASSPAVIAPPPLPLAPSALRPARRRVFAAAAVALAACLAILAFPTIQLRIAADHMTGIAELGEFLLEDGSRVTLDAASALAVDYSAVRRSVKLLSGQAFFEVVPSPERPFVVAAADVDVTVTGTSFSVGTSDMGVAIAVATGRVSVSRHGKELADLTVGQRVRMPPEGAPTRDSVAADEVAAWRGRRLVVHEATVREVVEQIGRHIPGAVVFRDSAIADRRVTGVIDLTRPSEALHAVIDLQQGKILQISPYLTLIQSR